MSMFTSGFLKVLVQLFIQSTTAQTRNSLFPGSKFKNISFTEIMGTAEEINTDLLTHQFGGRVGYLVIFFSCKLRLVLLHLILTEHYNTSAHINCIWDVNLVTEF